jgi:hypothetical protein
LKARYFPDRNILNSIPIDGMSYTWRSILHGVNLVREGYICRIGNGEKVKIWDDPWVPVLWNPRISIPTNGNLLERVADLISPITGTWDEQLVVDTFSESKARMILSMLVSDTVEDFIAWHFDDKGMFSVKQAYKLKLQLVENERRGGRSSSNMHDGGMDRGGDESGTISGKHQFL